MTTEPIALDGFSGWVPFAALPTADVPAEPGVYVIVRPSDDPPSFLEASPAGHFKGKDPTVPVADLQQLWVPGTRIVYIGKANHGSDGRRGLRKRLDEFRRFGAGEPVGHSGGRRIWQLADHADPSTLEHDVVTFLQEWLDSKYAAKVSPSLTGQQGHRVLALTASIDGPAAAMVKTIAENPHAPLRTSLRLPPEIDALVVITEHAVLQFNPSAGWSHHALVATPDSSQNDITECR